MFVDASETLFALSTLLWLGASIAAAAILFGAIHRRRTRLTESLREYVDRCNELAEKQRAAESKKSNASSE